MSKDLARKDGCNIMRLECTVCGCSFETPEANPEILDILDRCCSDECAEECLSRMEELNE